MPVLEQQGVNADNTLLEKALRPFLKPETRRLLDRFTRPATSRSARLSEERKRCENDLFHEFDKRRMHFPRFGELDQTLLSAAPKKLFLKLLNKSRDEIEQQFMVMEQVLQHHEKKEYVFVIFNLAGHFESPLALKFPQALPEEKMDACFLEEVCCLNSDTAFWADLILPESRHEYLIRYACWFFDLDFHGGNYLDDLAWQFKGRHHGHRPPGSRRNMPLEDALRVLGVKQEELADLTVKTLTRQYRRLAKRHHPDQGGQHETFIRLNRAFQDILSRIKTGRNTFRYHNSG